MPANYDRLAPKYDRAIRPLERWFLQDLRKDAIAALPDKARILEIGAGTGANFPWYERQRCVAAIEPSWEMLRIATTKQSTTTEITLLQSCAEQLPFNDGSFDGALATLVLCSVESQEQVFMELKRVVRRGGTVSLLEHVRPAGVLGPFFDLINLITVPLINDHVNRRTADNARQAGLTIKSVRKVGAGVFNLITCEV